MPGNEKGAVSLDSVRNQILTYEHQIKEYLDKLEAKVDTYKFSVERHGEGLTIDIAFRATVHAKGSK
ncbi:MAG: hypothetical protein OK422_06035 [Thaumarchaeota archaeon]|nr:hypothetical protein [Nitrososphaerota archaeon]